MIVQRTVITGTRPTRKTVTQYSCDQCGRICCQNGIKEDRLYWHGSEHLCFECLWEALEDDGTVQLAE